jgi:hypothetical protein
MSANNPKAVYQERVKYYQLAYQKIHRKYSNIALLRLCLIIIAIVTLFAGIQYNHASVFYVTGTAVLLFVLLIQWHNRIKRQRLLVKTLLHINETELTYVEHQTLPFADGAQYSNDQHPYTSDLDVFGARSLYQHLNRTATCMGSDSLAIALQSPLPEHTITAHQQAIQELTEDREYRQQYYAQAIIADDNAGLYQNLLQWSQQAPNSLPRVWSLLAWVLPITALVTGMLYWLTDQEGYWNIFNKVIVLNIIIFLFLSSKIKKEMFSTERINDLLSAYSGMLTLVEQREHQSPLLQQLKQTLQQNDTVASQALMQLSKIYRSMETIQNPFAAFIQNGLYLHHIHQYQKLYRWRLQHATAIQDWLQVIGTMEMLNSFANLYDNNPDYSFPTINNNHKIAFQALGHPLLNYTKRINNDVSFDGQRFIILTGSNMSGKSTFLRTLGVNMILASAGSPICAASATIHPMPILVSMRQSDSLADSESYFFAEVKRLHYLISLAAQQPSFLLLDEILRGTNSDDKRSGTIGVIEKLIPTQAMGAIATHDLEVCHTTDKYPNILTNKCFEVQIINDELVFDYKLRSGICVNKSATFLMKKMNIIN